MNWLRSLFGRRVSGSLLADDSNLFKLIKELASLSNDHYEPFILQNPALLSRRRLEKIINLHGGLFKKYPALSNAVRYAEAFRNRLAKDISKVPLGRGPIESLVYRQTKGEISLSEALRIASSQKVTFQLSLIYVSALSRANERRASSEEWRQAIAAQQLVLSAVDGLKPYSELDEFKMRCEADLSWLNIIRQAMVFVPNGEIYADAMIRGRALEELAQHRGDNEERASALHRMGTLNLDPYSVGHPLGDTLWYDEWLKNARDEFGSVRSEELLAKLPTPKEAIEKAIHLLTQASELRSGRQRGLSLKALAQAQMEFHELGGDVEPHAIIETVRRASEVLDPDEDNEPLSVATSIRRHCEQLIAGNAKAAGPTAGSKDIGRDFEKALQLAKSVIAGELDNETDNDRQKNTALSLASVARAASLNRLFDGLTLFKAADILMRQSLAGDQLIQFVHFECVTMLVEVFEGELDFVVPNDFDELSKILATKAATKSWPDKADIFASIAVAARLASTDQEELALKVIDGISKSGDVWNEWFSALSSLPAKVYTGAAVNAVSAGDLEQAVRFYLLGFEEFLLKANLRYAALDLLYRTIDLVRKFKSVKLSNLLADLVTPVLNAERISDVAVEYVHQLCRELLAATHRTGTGNSREIMLLFQLAKGLRFGELAGVSSPQSLQLNFADYTNLTAIANLEATAARSRFIGDTTISEILLCSYLEIAEPTSGEDDAGRIRNLRHSFDRCQVSKMISAARPTPTTQG